MHLYIRQKAVKRIKILVISVPFSGNYRHYAGDVANVGSEGDFWSSTSNSSRNAYNLNFNSNNLNPQNNNSKGNGLTVRCVAQ